MLGLSALPTGHPLNMGMLGMHGNYAPNMKEQECDVLIAIGMRFSDRVICNPATYAKQAKIIQLDIDGAEIDKNVKTDVAVVADCKESLPAITKLLRLIHTKNGVRVSDRCMKRNTRRLSGLQLARRQVRFLWVKWLRLWLMQQEAMLFSLMM